MSTLLSFGALAVLATPARAEEPADLRDLEGLLNESVVSTASKASERASTAPAQIISIAADQIRAFGIRSVDEALNFLGVGMYAARTVETMDYHGVVEEVGSRGVMLRDGGSRILVLIDGHATNSQLDGRSWINGALGMPIEMIDHIEVMLGPGSVMYGSSAFLAVVNVVSKRARDIRGISGTASVSLQPPQGDDRNLTSVGRGDSLGAMYRLSLAVGHEFTLFKRPAELTAQVEWIVGNSSSYRAGPQYADRALDLGVLPRGSGPWRGTTSHSVNAPALVAALRVGDWRLAVQLSSFDRSMPFAGGLGAGSQANTRHLGLNLSHSSSLGQHFTLFSRLYADATEQTTSQQYSLSLPPDFPGGATMTNRRLSQWLGLEEQGVVDWRLDGRLVTTIGFDVRARRSQALLGLQRDPLTGEVALLDPPIGIDSITMLGGVYLQQVYQPLKWLGLNAGLRVDFDQLFGAHVSPRAAVVVTSFQGNTIKVMYTEAFRAPTPIDLGASDFFERIRPLSLKPEVVRSIELEVSQRWSSGRAALDGFLSYYSDIIGDRLPSTTEYDAALADNRIEPAIPRQRYAVLDNVGAMRSFGGSLSVEQRLPYGLSGGLNVLLSKTDMTDQGGVPQTMLLTPTWFGNGHLLWQPRPDGFSIGLAVLLLGARTPLRVSALSPSLPIIQRTSADLRLTGTIPISRVKGLSARLIADYNTDGRAPIQVGGPAMLAPNAAPELLPLPRAFFMAEVRYEY